MLTPNELESIPTALQQQFRGLESRVMQDVVRRLQNANDFTNSAEQQLAVLYSNGYSARDIENLVGNTLDVSQGELNQIMAGIIGRYNSQQGQFENGIPYSQNKELQQLVNAVTAQTMGSFQNITQSMGFAVREGAGLKFLPIADFYQKTLDGAMLDLSSGAFDYNTVINRVITQMTNSGLRTVDYASGRSDRVEVAVRRAVMTGVNQVTAKITEQNMDTLGTEYVEVSYHGGARPSHQVWQGKVYHWDRGGKSKNSQDKPLTNGGDSGIIKENINTEHNQDYRPVTFDGELNQRRGSIDLNLRHCDTTVNNIYFSDRCNLSRKELHNIDTQFSRALKLIGISENENLPPMYIITHDEMQKNAVASYNAVKNVISVDELFGKGIDRIKLIQKDGACSNNVLSTMVHELYHWVDAQEYEKYFGKLTAENYSEYINRTNAKRKAIIKKLGINELNVADISLYAKISFEENDFNEVYTEYRTKKILGE